MSAAVFAAIGQSRPLKAWSLAGGALAALIAGSSAHAQSGELEEIVVTARRTAESLQETPISITALSSESLERARIVSVNSIQQLTPNLAMTQQVGALGAITAYMRGIGSGENQMSIDPPIGIYLDGVYIGRNNQANFELVDLERVEVLRGPQGTLFGRNTTGGAISMVTREPADEFGVEQKFGFGSWNQWYSRTRLSTGLFGDSGIKGTISYIHRQQDGYVNNTLVKGKLDPGAQNSDSVWAKLQGEWGALRATYSVDYADLRGMPQTFMLEYSTPDVQRFFGPNSAALGGTTLIFRPGRQDDLPLFLPPRQKVTTEGHSLTLEYRFSELATLKSITGYRTFRSYLPGAYGPPGLLGVASTTNPAGPAIVRNVQFLTSAKNGKQHQFSEELQLLGTVGELSYVAGAYFYTETGLDNNTSTSTVVRPGGATAVVALSATTFRFDNESKAAFGQLNYRPGFLGEKVELAAGVRYSKDNKTVSQTAPAVRNGDITFDNTSYNITLTYDWSDDVMTYLRQGTGYRSGSFNTRAAATPNVPYVYRPERATVYEGGFKSELFDRRVRLNGAVYYTKYRDLQVTQYSFNAGAGGPQSYAFNANATYRGFELEGQALVTDRLTLDASVGYTKGKYSEIYLPGPTGVPTNYADIAHFSGVPKWTSHVGARYDAGSTSYGRVSLQADYSYQSKRYFTVTGLPHLNPLADQIASKAYGLLSARVTVSEIPLRPGLEGEISLWGQNLTDEEYRAQGIDFGASVGASGAVYGPPRSVGVDFRLTF